ncbi:hypothetical protein BAXH7_02706 [Bacillus amyloliquefaciens XH7]|nr:hypothetical protein LL3_02780 [Bacillus amyloliquefaciens LL3]AEK89832.1 hypothetical protein BAXH7_02706 [Bacillus amyloliquefaciens XH7]
MKRSGNFRPASMTLFSLRFLPHLLFRPVKLSFQVIYLEMKKTYRR